MGRMVDQRALRGKFGHSAPMINRTCVHSFTDWAPKAALFLGALLAEHGRRGPARRWSSAALVRVVVWTDQPDRIRAGPRLLRATDWNPRTTRPWNWWLGPGTEHSVKAVLAQSRRAMGLARRLEHQVGADGRLTPARTARTAPRPRFLACFRRPPGNYLRGWPVAARDPRPCPAWPSARSRCDRRAGGRPTRSLVLDALTFAPRLRPP